MAYQSNLEKTTLLKTLFANVSNISTKNLIKSWRNQDRDFSSGFDFSKNNEFLVFN